MGDQVRRVESGGLNLKPKKVWTAPEVRPMGNLKELVLGGGKSGSNADADPSVQVKSGTG